MTDMKKMKKILNPSIWGLATNRNNELTIHDFLLTDFAELYGTPLYVLDETRLASKASGFKCSAEKNYPGSVSVHYPFKCNSVPAVVDTIKTAGLKAEVMTEFELDLAMRSGFEGNEIIANGPCKTDSFLKKCLDADIKLISIDSTDELKSLAELTTGNYKRTNILLRVNPDYIPKGLPAGSATGSGNSVFGLNLKTNDINNAFRIITENRNLSFQGFHFHIGTGISDPSDYKKAINKLIPIFQYIINQGFKINVIDVGGGYPSPGTRELKTSELILSQIFKYLQYKQSSSSYSIEDFTKCIGREVSALAGNILPELIYEPGRSIVSSCQHLLLKVQRIKRGQAHKWLITDGGLGTITLPTYYEYHNIFLANDVYRLPEEYVTITGPCCFSGDIIYKNMRMQKINKGEILALMDTGAYFNGFESNFGFARPAIISVSEYDYKLVRKRETNDDMLIRDLKVNEDLFSEVRNEI